ncbi:MAG: sulfatase [Pseudomonadota bacterium]|nr:sulfatase [Pseudomonadota bacterium]
MRVPALYILVAIGLSGCAPAADPARPPDLVVVSLDTLRADRLGAYGNRDGLTPSLDRFASEAVLFEHAYTQATNTGPAHASLFTSRYASEQDAGVRKPAIAPETKTLAEVLDAYGWDTAAFVGGGDLAPEMGIGRGFGTWSSKVDFGSLWHTTPLALSWLDQRPAGAAPSLLFVHGYDVHMPYLKPTPFGYTRADKDAVGPGQDAVRSTTERMLDGWFHGGMSGLMHAETSEVRPRSPDARARTLAVARTDRVPPREAAATDLALVRGVYDGSVTYADAMFGLLMAGLQDRGVLDRSVVVVLSDHGEQLGEDGVFHHSWGVSDAEAHVVLMVRLPGGAEGGRRVTGQVGLIDVMPTLLELVGAAPPARIHGQSFAAGLRGEPFAGRPVAWTQGGRDFMLLGARTPAGRLVYSGMPARSPVAAELVETAALPGPSFTAHGSLDAAAQGALRGEMAPWLRTLSPAPAQQDDATLPDALRASLRAHGYWDVQP